MPQTNQSTPHGISASSQWILVADPHLDLSTYPLSYGQSELLIIDPNSGAVLNRHKASGVNAAHITVGNDFAYLTSTGPLAFIDGSHRRDGPGLIEGYDLTRLDRSSASDFSVVVDGAIGSLTLAGDRAHAGDALAPVLYQLSRMPLAFEKGPDDPIVVQSATSVDTTGALSLGDGRVAVTSCNTNSLRFYDVKSNALLQGPLSLIEDKGCAEKPECLECPYAMAHRQDEVYPDLFVLKAVGNHVARVDTRNGTVEPNWASVGPVANDLHIGAPWLYVVNSGSNSVQRIHMETGLSETFAIFDVGSNPYGVTVAFDSLWVTLLNSGQVARIQLDNPGVITLIDLSMAGPNNPN